MTPEMAALCSRIARRAARSFARSYPWMSADDIEQDIWAHFLPRIKLLDPAAPEAPAYLQRLAMTAAKRAVWKMGAVANVPRREAEKGEIKRQRAGSLDDEAIVGMPDQAARADAALEQAEERSKLAQIVADHLANDEEGQAILAVLTGEMKSKQAAETHNVPLTRLYWRTQQVTQAMRADPRFQEFV